MNIRHKTPLLANLRAAFIGLVFVISLFISAELKAWPAIFNESNGLDAERIDPDSHAENLIRWVEVEHSRHDFSTAQTFYYRVKVFDEKGVDQLKLITLEGVFDAKINRVKARVTYPNGQVEEIEKDTFVQNERFRQGRYRSKTVSFPPPKLEPGCVIDFTWNSIFEGILFEATVFPRAPNPTHTFVFRMRFHEFFSPRWTWNNFDGESFKDLQTGGFHEIILKNQPARPDEDFLPSPTDIQPWITVFNNTSNDKDWVEQFWQDYAIHLHETLRNVGRPKHRLIREKAEGLIAGEHDKLKQLQKLYSFCQQEIKNINDPYHGFTSDEKAAMNKKLDSVDDVLSEGHGNYYYIDLLFASLAEAAGFEVRYVRMNDRRRSSFSKNMVFQGSMPTQAIAVRTSSEEDWIFCSPGDRFLPFGRLHFTNEPATALLSHPKKAEFVVTPMANSSLNWTKRMGDFSIDEYGTLTGTVKLVYQGQLAVIERANYEDTSEQVRIEKIKDEFSENFSNFTVENVQISNLRDTKKALVIKFDLRVEGYCDFTPTRLFLNPSIFQQGQSRFFTKKKRDYDIVFPFLQTVRDEIHLKLPEDYILENPGFPKGALNEAYLKHQISVSYDNEKHTIDYLRNYELNQPLFRVNVYPAVCALYETIYNQDNQLLTLKKKEDADAEPVGAPETPPETGTASVSTL